MSYFVINTFKPLNAFIYEKEIQIHVAPDVMLEVLPSCSAFLCAAVIDFVLEFPWRACSFNSKDFEGILVDD